MQLRILCKKVNEELDSLPDDLRDSLRIDSESEYRPAVLAAAHVIACYPSHDNSETIIEVTSGDTYFVEQSFEEVKQAYLEEMNMM